MSAPQRAAGPRVAASSAKSGASTAPPGSGAMFDGIAARYDLLNRLMSLGLDRRWRRRLVRAVLTDAVQPPLVLDLATGTADVALALLAADRALRVVGLDPSAQMLAQGARKTAARAALAAGRLRLLRGDALRLPYGGATFGACCVAFGIRNVPDRLAALREMRRVTAPGGLVAVLELGEPRQGWLAPLARWHVQRVVPALGAWLSGAPEYRYLQRSMAAFPAPGAFLALLEQAGLRDAHCARMGLGSVHLFTARVPHEQALDAPPGAAVVRSPGLC